MHYLSCQNYILGTRMHKKHYISTIMIYWALTDNIIKQIVITATRSLTNYSDKNGINGKKYKKIIEADRAKLEI